MSKTVNVEPSFFCVWDLFNVTTREEVRGKII